jgi:4-amino-4-deoxy-L-arabinose transferase-like glycosyltransferase
MKTPFTKVQKYLPFFVFALAFFLRIYQIQSNPPSLNWDEVSHGYNAYSILKTSKDEWGTTLPSIFKAYGDYKLPVYIYLTSISIHFLGISPLAIRLPSVIAGTLTVTLSYFLFQKFFGKNKTFALTCAFLVAIEPWSLFLSRGAFEANVALTFFLAGAYFLLSKNNKATYIPISLFFFGLSVWTYNSFRIFTPLFIFSYILLFKKEINVFYKKHKFSFLFSTVLTIAFFLPMALQLASQSGIARYSWVSIINEGSISEIIALRQKSQFSSSITRLLYNRPAYFLYHFTKNYFSYFSPIFLYFKGGSHYQFNIPNKAILYPIGAPFLLAGLFFLLRKKNKSKTHYLILIWIILAPIPAALTQKSPHTLRSITLLPLPMLLTAFGLFTLVKSLKNKGKILLPLYLLTTTFFLYTYKKEYFTNYRNNYSQSWQYGYEQIVDYSKENYQNYDKIVVTKKYGEPHEFFLLFWPWDPQKYQNDSNLIRFKQSNWFWVDSFDKFYFVNDWNITNQTTDIFTLESGGEVNCKNPKCLLITSPKTLPSNWHFVRSINFLDGKTAFEIYEN